MKWSKPALVPLNMNAEIGAYQNDFDGDPRPIVAPASTQEEPEFTRIEHATHDELEVPPLRVVGHDRMIERLASLMNDLQSAPGLLCGFP